jgi:hypothetical protein
LVLQQELARIEPLPCVKDDTTDASDHALVWARFEL